MSVVAPSLECVPGKYNAGLLFSQLPMDGSGDFTVTRTTTPTAGKATRVNAAGLIETVTDNVPRLDYLQPDGTIGCPALLVEPAATNLLLRSEEFNDAYWGKTQQGTGLNPVVTPNNAISPDGNQTADLVVFNRGAGNSSNDRSILSSTSTIISGSQYNGSVWVKAATPSDVGKQIAFRHVAQATHLVITLTANWVRYNQTELSALTAGDWRLVNIGTVTADNVVGVHVWGAQLELGSVATSYIPTTTAAVTRSADVISKTGATALIGQTEGTVYLEVNAPNASQQAFAIGTGGTNSIHIYKIASSQYRASINGQSGGGSVDLTDSIARTGFVKLAVAYKSGESALVANGSTPVTSATSLTFGALTSVNFFGTYQAALPFWVRALALYPTRRSNIDLVNMTAPDGSFLWGVNEPIRLWGTATNENWG